MHYSVRLRHTRPAGLQCLRLHRGGLGALLLWVNRGSNQLIALHWLWGPTSPWEPLPTIGAEVVLSHLWVSKALFHPVLDCVFSLATLTPQCGARKCLEFCPGSDNQCVVFCATAWASVAAVRMEKKRDAGCILRHS